MPFVIWHCVCKCWFADLQLLDAFICHGAAELLRTGNALIQIKNRQMWWLVFSLTICHDASEAIGQLYQSIISRVALFPPLCFLVSSFPIVVCECIWPCVFVCMCGCLHLSSCCLSFFSFRIQLKAPVWVFFLILMSLFHYFVDSYCREIKLRWYLICYRQGG